MCTNQDTEHQQDTQIATIILAQLGGRMFRMMTGSSQFVAGSNFLRMKLTRNKARAQYLQVNLDPDDTYSMDFFKISRTSDEMKKITVSQFDGVYFDMLQDIFTDVTGLYTKF